MWYAFFFLLPSQRNDFLLDFFFNNLEVFQDCKISKPKIQHEFYRNLNSYYQAWEVGRLFPSNILEKNVVYFMRSL